MSELLAACGLRSNSGGLCAGPRLLGRAELQSRRRGGEHDAVGSGGRCPAPAAEPVAGWVSLARTGPPCVNLGVTVEQTYGNFAFIDLLRLELSQAGLFRVLISDLEACGFLSL